MTQQEFLDRFSYSVLRDRIGGGGFGTVYKAYDNVLHRDVAIKVSEVKTTADGKKTFSLKDEFKALHNVPKHPNIANYEELYSFESPQGIFDYAVMQYYPDGNLNSLIKEGLTNEQKEDVARQLLEGVAFLHRHNVVHRDLKPGNILIVKHSGKVIPLITDFGLSKTAEGDGGQFSNSFGGGTQRYSSPEQLQGKPLRFNTDLWSYGAILYEIFTGSPVFESSSGAANTAQSDLEIYNKIMSGDVGSRVSALPGKWSVIAKRCLVVDPEQRAKSADEFKYLFEDTNFDTPVPKESKPARPVTADSDETSLGETHTQKTARQIDMEAREQRRMERYRQQPNLASAPATESAKALVVETVTAPAKKSRTWLWVTLVALLLAAVGGLVYYMMQDASKRTERLIVIYNEKVSECEFNINNMAMDKSNKVGNELFIIPALEGLQEIEKMEKGDMFKKLGIASCYDDLFAKFRAKLKEAKPLIEEDIRRQIDSGLNDEEDGYYLGLLRRKDLIDNLLKQSEQGSALEMMVPKSKK